MKYIPNAITYACLLILIVGCTTATGPKQSPQLYKVKVDSVKYASPVAVGDTIVVRLYGTIGSDGCHSLSQVQDTKSDHQVDLTVWGKAIPAAGCPAVMVYLDGRPYKVLASEQGPFLIRIHQPDGSVLVNTVQVQ